MEHKENHAAILISDSARETVEFYWLAMANLQNLLEDVEGADGRRNYLIMLRLRLIELLQKMDGVRCGGATKVGDAHHLATALKKGISFMGWSGPDVLRRMALDRPVPEYHELRACLIEQIEIVLRAIPGPIVDAQGPQGQRNMLRAMRDWSTMAGAADEDISFLADYFKEL